MLILTFTFRFSTKFAHCCYQSYLFLNNFFLLFQKNYFVLKKVDTVSRGWDRSTISRVVTVSAL